MKRIDIPTPKRTLPALLALAALVAGGCSADTGGGGGAAVTVGDDGGAIDDAAGDAADAADASSDSGGESDAADAVSDDAVTDATAGDDAVTDATVGDDAVTDASAGDDAVVGDDSTTTDANADAGPGGDTTTPDTTTPDTTTLDADGPDTKPAPGCCKVDDDCDGDDVCFFGPWNAGKCMSKAGLAPGACWASSHCAQGEVCEGGMACGCDAFCKAMDSPGTCKGPGPKTCSVGLGAADTDCGAGMFCELDPKAGCAGSGVCSPIPQACDAVYAPVCGCDGKTYGNTCEAAGNGQNAASEGECPNKCLTVKCGDGNPCTSNPCDPKTGQCLVVPQLGAACDDGDACTKDDVCKDVYGTAQCSPGKYVDCPAPKDCETVACNSKTGQCEATPVPGCNGNIGKKCSLGMGAPTIDCGPDAYCELPDGAKCVGFGLCAQKPMICTKEFKETCGCDGQTYGNPCMTKSAGTNVAHDGACGGGGGAQCCTGDNTCGGKGETCVKTSGGGVCKSSLELGKNQCWSDSQCGGAVCIDAVICPCGSVCKAPDSPGYCSAGGTGCCKQDGDCKTGVCAGTMCKDPGELQAGQCWTDAQCGGAPCKGANVCPCGAQCFAADKPGTCEGVK
jgi:hypothetical protein